MDSCTRSDLIGWRHFAALLRCTIHAVAEGQLEPNRPGLKVIGTGSGQLTAQLPDA
jgi:hypothetical protein